ncbi:hypothetical protein EDB92DRAFT_788291 [Lactarius akahatsu]|uniref:Uncharacterized protein n=1 Tax=Lactarius akahatsu TaxID=416441 RepID=A0AAD4LI40_9AGAM|nr:hypothetical protein EDB92DRAFT_788291 [Lactarius akahatsu]
MGTTAIDLWSCQISKEQHRAANDYLSGPLPESPHYGSTSFGVMVPNSLLPFERLGSAYIEALLGTGDPAPTPSASLTQDYHPSPASTTFQTDAHQPSPPSSWPSQINGTTTSATTTPGDPKQCPACQAHFNRKQDCEPAHSNSLPALDTLSVPELHLARQPCQTIIQDSLGKRPRVPRPPHSWTGAIRDIQPTRVRKPDQSRHHPFGCGGSRHRTSSCKGSSTRKDEHVNRSMGVDIQTASAMIQNARILHYSFSGLSNRQILFRICD